MLPHIKSTAITLVTALTLALTLALTSAAPAAAWGQREQDTLKGAVGALVLKAIIDDATGARRSPPVYYEQPAAPRHHDHTKKRDHDREYAPSHNSIYRTPAAHAFNSYSSSERRLIQRRLAHWGYYRSRVDGSFGPGTYAAVTAYARDNGQGRDLGSTAGAFGVYDGLIY